MTVKIAKDVTKSRKNKTEPNKAIKPTPVNVTIPTDAGLAPFTSVSLIFDIRQNQNLVRL